LAKSARRKKRQCHIGVIAILDSSGQSEKAGACPMDARSPDSGVAVSQTWRPDRCDRIALVLQGGGALGAYQVGGYQALHDAALEPNWVCGVSIGGINSAIIAGNPPEERLDKLRVFWGRITARKGWHYTAQGDVWRKGRHPPSTLPTTAPGQPGCFQPPELHTRVR